jgi:hypothetical protein
VYVPHLNDFASFAESLRPLRLKTFISAAGSKDKILNRKVRQGFRKGRKETAFHGCSINLRFFRSTTTRSKALKKSMPSMPSIFWPKLFERSRMFITTT